MDGALHEGGPGSTCSAKVKIPQAGEQCPRCGSGRLDYNGLLELVCESCGYRAPDGGAFT